MLRKMDLGVRRGEGRIANRAAAWPPAPWRASCVRVRWGASLALRSGATGGDTLLADTHPQVKPSWASSQRRRARPAPAFHTGTACFQPLGVLVPGMKHCVCVHPLRGPGAGLRPGQPHARGAVAPPLLEHSGQCE